MPKNYNIVWHPHDAIVFDEIEPTKYAAPEPLYCKFSMKRALFPVHVPYFTAIDFTAMYVNNNKNWLAALQIFELQIKSVHWKDKKLAKQQQPWRMLICGHCVSVAKP